MALGLALSAAFAMNAAAAPAEPLVKELAIVPKTILIVGNSYMYYNCGMNGYLKGMIAQKLNPKVKTRIAATGRSNMSQQPIEELLDNSKLRSHDLRYGTIEDRLLEKEIKKREKYELVLMQGSNRGVDDQARDAHYVKIHAEAIRKQGGTPAMIMTWTQKKKSAPAFEVVQEGVTKIANDNNMMVIPVGIAFNKAQARYPELKFIMPDNTHPTAIGSYLMASTIFASVYNRDPMEAVDFAGGCEKPIDKDIREKLHAVAWETVREFYKR